MLSEMAYILASFTRPLEQALQEQYAQALVEGGYTMADDLVATDEATMLSELDADIKIPKPVGRRLIAAAHLFIAGKQLALARAEAYHARAHTHASSLGVLGVGEVLALTRSLRRRWRCWT